LSDDRVIVVVAEMKERDERFYLTTCKLDS
jgi:hypothetical protein